MVEQGGHRPETIKEMRRAYAAEQAERTGHRLCAHDLVYADQLPDRAITAYHAAKRQAQEADDETLRTMFDSAYNEYFKLAIRPNTNPSKADLEPLEVATARYEAISYEVEKRWRDDGHGDGL